jgi:hypothetical protein
MLMDKLKKNSIKKMKQNQLIKLICKINDLYYKNRIIQLKKIKKFIKLNL